MDLSKPATRLLESPSLDIVSNPGESERDFRVRLQQIAREHRDEAVESCDGSTRLSLKCWRIVSVRLSRRSSARRNRRRARRCRLRSRLGQLCCRRFRPEACEPLDDRQGNNCRPRCRPFDEETEDIERAQDNVAAISQARGSRSRFQAETRALETSLDPQTEQARDRQSKTDESKHRCKGADSRLGAILGRQTRMGKII